MTADKEGFTIPTEPGMGRSSELVGELVALRPTKFDQAIETKIGSNEATFVEALIVTGAGEYRNLGELPIFWEVVRRQLHDAEPWLVGRIAKQGRAYRMAPPGTEEIEAVRMVLKRHTTNPIPAERPEEEGEPGDGFPEEAPF